MWKSKLRKVDKKFEKEFAWFFKMIHFDKHAFKKKDAEDILSKLQELGLPKLPTPRRTIRTTYRRTLMEKLRRLLQQIRDSGRTDDLIQLFSNYKGMR